MRKKRIAIVSILIGLVIIGIVGISIYFTSGGESISSVASCPFAPLIP